MGIDHLLTGMNLQVPAISKVITPCIGGVNPSYTFIRPFLGVITPFFHLWICLFDADGKSSKNILPQGGEQW